MMYKFIKLFLPLIACGLIGFTHSFGAPKDSQFTGMQKFVQEKSCELWLNEQNRLNKNHNGKIDLLAQLKNIGHAAELMKLVENMNILTKESQKYISEELIEKITLLCTLHALYFFALQIYESIKYIKTALNYWNSVQNMSLLHYCATHAPTHWYDKIHGDLHTAQNIQAAKKYLTEYEGYLGEIASLLYLVPITDTRAAWTINSLHKIAEISDSKSREHTNALLLLHAVVTHAPAQYDTHFSTIKAQIQKEPYLVRNGTKIILGGIALAASAWVTVKNFDTIAQWCEARIQSCGDAFNDFVYKPARNTIRTIFYKERMTENTVKPLDPEVVKKTVEKLKNYHPELSDTEAFDIIHNENVSKMEDVSFKTNFAWAPWQTVNDGSIYALLVKRQLQKQLFDFQDRSQLTQQIVLLTPFILALWTTSNLTRTLYQKLTKRDYRHVAQLFKELETFVICNTTEIASDYALFGHYLSILAFTRKEVVRIISSRYTNQERILEDLMLLESYTLSNEQRYRLIEQLRKSYTIFQVPVG